MTLTKYWDLGDKSTNVRHRFSLEEHAAKSQQCCGKITTPGVDMYEHFNEEVHKQ